MNRYFFIFLILTFFSCQNKGKGIEFIIENKSDFSIKNVRVTTSENLTEKKFKELNPNQKISDYLLMENNKSDGCYILEYHNKDEKKFKKCFGYYTNGAPIEKSVKFDIKNDTVIVNFKIY